MAPTMRLILVLAVSCALISPAEAQKRPDSPMAAAKIVVPSVTYAGQPFRDVLVDISRRSGVTIAVDWADLAVSCGIRPDTKVSFEGGDLTIASCLDLALSRAAGKNRPAAWYISPGGFTVASRRRLLGLPTGALARIKRADEGAASSERESRDSPRPARSTIRRGQDMRFENTPASEVMDFFREAMTLSYGKINMSVRWPALEAIGITPETPVTLALNQKVDVRVALDLALEAMSQAAGGSGNPVNSAWSTWDRGVLIITSGADLNTQVEIRSWYIGDLLFSRPDFKGPTMGVQSSEVDGGGSSETDLFEDTEGENAQDAAQARQQRIDQITSVITRSIAPAFWQPVGMGSARVLRNRLVVSQTKLGFILLERSTGLR